MVIRFYLVPNKCMFFIMVNEIVLYLGSNQDSDLTKESVLTPWLQRLLEGGHDAFIKHNYRWWLVYNITVCTRQEAQVECLLLQWPCDVRYASYSQVHSINSRGLLVSVHWRKARTNANREFYFYHMWFKRSITYCSKELL